jgi:VIT1/CCC1 family predicted Fe2+/Mn2+ transporter
LARRRGRKSKAGALLRRAFFFVLGSLLLGFLAVFLEQSLGLYLPRHFAVSLAVGLAVAATFWLLGLLKHPPLLLRNVHPVAAGLCAGLGVHIARFWLR